MSEEVKGTYSTSIARTATISNREGERTRMVSHHAVSRVDKVHVIGTDVAKVRASTSQLLDATEQTLEEVNVVVGALLLQDRGHALEAGARVDVLVRQRVESVSTDAVVLHEHEVPDLDHVGIVHVDERGSIAASDAIVVDLAARAARSCTREDAR